MSSFRRDRMQYSQSHSFSRRRFITTSNKRSLSVCTILAFFVFCPAFSQAPSDQIAAERKVRLIEANRWPPARSISFTAGEILALGLSSANSAAPGAILNPVLHLRQNGATAFATIDFDRLRSKPLNGSSMSDWLTAKLVTGQHPISVSARVNSAKGQMTVHPESVTISGVTVAGDALHFLIQEFILPRYPGAVIDRPFSLSSNIREIRVTPDTAQVLAK